MLVIQLEKEGLKTEAVVHDLKGEILTAELKDPIMKRRFQTGDVVSFRFQDVVHRSRILYLNQQEITLFLPVLKADVKEDLRTQYRVPHRIKAVAMTHSSMYQGAVEASDIEIVDISPNGIGFESEKEFPLHSVHTILPEDEDLPIKADVFIRHSVETMRGFRYGAKVQRIMPEHLHILNRYILKHRLTCPSKELVLP